MPAVGMEFNLSLRDPRMLTGPQWFPQIPEIVLEEREIGVAVRLTLDPPGELVVFPVETVSESEGGLERTIQGIRVVCLWTLEPGSGLKARVQWQVLAPPAAGAEGGPTTALRPAVQGRVARATQSVSGHGGSTGVSRRTTTRGTYRRGGTVHVASDARRSRAMAGGR